MIRINRHIPDDVCSIVFESSPDWSAEASEIADNLGWRIDRSWVAMNSLAGGAAIVLQVVGPDSVPFRALVDALNNAKIEGVVSNDYADRTGT